MRTPAVVGDVVVGADRYGGHGVLLTLADPADVPAVVQALGGRAGWRSVLVPGDGDPERVLARVSTLPLVAAAVQNDRGITVPVVYDGADLDRVADHLGCTPAEVVAAHTAATYTVVMLGFGRAFPYLAGLPAALRGLPRLATPRATVPAGSVAVVADMAGIYPAAMPGGWPLIGTTPLALFDPTCDPPTPLAPGARIRFEVAT